MGLSRRRKGQTFFLHCVVLVTLRCFFLNSELLGQKSVGLIFFTCLVTQSCPTLFNPRGCSLPGSSVHGDSLGKNTGEGRHALLPEIFPTQGRNPGLLHCRRTLYLLSHQGRNAFMLGDTVVFLLFPVTSTIYATGSQTCVFQTLPSF